jgi:hypothetical protein
LKFKEAIGDATKKIFDELLKKGLLTLHDLCDLHIHFPHPDQQTCPGVEISPCDLIHPVLTTPSKLNFLEIKQSPKDKI